jgi:hypothetical protein
MIPVLSLMLLISAHQISPRENKLDILGFLAYFFLLLFFQSIFIVFALIGFKDEKRTLLKSISEGFLFWQYITFIPGFLVNFLFNLTNNRVYSYLLLIYYLILGSYLVVRYKLPRGFFLLAFFVPGFSILFFLIYGLNKQYKLNPINVNLKT